MPNTLQSFAFRLRQNMVRMIAKNVRSKARKECAAVDFHKHPEALHLVLIHQKNEQFVILVARLEVVFEFVAIEALRRRCGRVWARGPARHLTHTSGARRGGAVVVALAAKRE